MRFLAGGLCGGDGVHFRDGCRLPVRVGLGCQRAQQADGTRRCQTTTGIEPTEAAGTTKPPFPLPLPLTSYQRTPTKKGNEPMPGNKTTIEISEDLKAKLERAAEYYGYKDYNGNPSIEPYIENLVRWHRQSASGLVNT